MVRILGSRSIQKFVSKFIKIGISVHIQAIERSKAALFCPKNFGLFWFELSSNFHNEESNEGKIGCGGGMRQNENEERKVGRMTVTKGIM